MKKSRKNQLIIGGLLLILIISLVYISGIKENSFSNVNSKITSSLNRFSISEIDTSIPIREYYLRASEINAEIIKGKNTSMYGYNGMSPGPILRGKVGDTFKIMFQNDLKEESSIHWHGMQLPNSQDGVPDVTQTSVKPGETFTYEFTLKNPGIYWYHPHYNTADQIERGLYGYIIVDDENSLINSDNDIIYSLDDIRLNSNGKIAEAGSGHMDTMHGRYGNQLLINGENSFNIEGKKGDIIRLRLINTANARIFRFGIDKHKLLVIGHDIGYVEKPYEVNYIDMAPGERYDILVQLNNEVKDYNILSYEYRQNLILGKLKYLNETSTSVGNQEYYDTLKNQVLNNELPDWTNKLEVEEDFSLNLLGVAKTMGSLKWTINEKTYPEGPENLDLKEGEFYKIKLFNTQGQVHPMHLHGQKFLILSRNGIPVKEKGWKDTVIVGGKETVEIGLIAEGIGTWVNHCHILEHAEAGMLSTLSIS